MRYRVNRPLKRVLLALSSAVLVLTGCAAPYTYYCGDGCGPTSFSGRHAACQAAACDPCQGTEAGACGGYTITGALRNMFTCGSGCGEMYWGEWSYDPPDPCDPCNDHGDWTGPGCCPPSCWARLWQGLRGARLCGGTCGGTCEPSCGGDGCDGCESPGSTMLEGELLEGEMIMEGELLEGGAMESLDELEMSEPFPVSARQPPPTRTSRRPAQPHYSRDPNSRLVRRAQ